METKKIYKVEISTLTNKEAQKVCDQISKHIQLYIKKLYIKDFQIYKKSNWIYMAKQAIKEGSIVIDMDEVKKRTTTEQLRGLINELVEVAKYSTEYKKNKEKYNNNEIN